MESTAFWAAATLYAVSTVLLFVATVFDREAAERWGTRAAAAGLAPHALSLALRWQEVGHGPFSTRYEVVSANALLLVGLYLGSTALARGLRSLGVFVMPVAFLMLGVAVSGFGVRHEVPIIFRSAWLWLHIGFAKLFGASVVIAASCAAAYLLRSAWPGRLARLPAPHRLELWAHQFLLVAFLFLGVMIVAGALWAHQSWGRYWAWDPIESSSLLTWVSFGVILHFRVLHAWSGRRMAWLTFVALGLTVFTVYVVTLTAPTVHDFYLTGPR